MEVATFLPHVIDPGLHLLGFVDLRQFSCHSLISPFLSIVSSGRKIKNPRSPKTSGRNSPRYHLTSRKTGHSNCCNGQTRTSLLPVQEMSSGATIGSNRNCLAPPGSSLTQFWEPKLPFYTLLPINYHICLRMSTFFRVDWLCKFAYNIGNLCVKLRFAVPMKESLNIEFRKRFDELLPNVS